MRAKKRKEKQQNRSTQEKFFEFLLFFFLLFLQKKVKSISNEVSRNCVLCSEKKKKLSHKKPRRVAFLMNV